MLRRFFLLVATLAVVIPAHAAPGSQHWTQWARRAWTPRDLGGVLVESWADTGVTLGDTPRASGTSPPALTYTGTLTGGVVPCVQIDGAGARGTATFKVSYDDCATFPHTGILTAATVALPGIGSAITANWPVGTYSTNNVYLALAAQVNDLNGSNHATESTAANRPVMRAVAFNGKPALDYGTAGTLGMQTSAFSLGVYTMCARIRGDASTQQVILHGSDTGSHASIWGTTNNSIQTTRSATTTAKNVAAGWLQDAARKTVCTVFNGTHASFLVYVNGTAVSTSDTVLTSDPGTGTISSPLYVGYRQTKTNGLRGLYAGWLVVNRALTAAEVRRWHDYAIARFP